MMLRTLLLAVMVISLGFLSPARADRTSGRTQAIKTQLAKQLSLKTKDNMHTQGRSCTASDIKIRTKVIGPARVGAVQRSISWVGPMMFGGTAVATTPVVPNGARPTKISDFKITRAPR